MHEMIYSNIRGVIWQGNKSYMENFNNLYLYDQMWLSEIFLKNIYKGSIVWHFLICMTAR